MKGCFEEGDDVIRKAIIGIDEENEGCADSHGHIQLRRVFDVPRRVVVQRCSFEHMKF